MSATADRLRRDADCGAVVTLTVGSNFLGVAMAATPMPTVG